MLLVEGVETAVELLALKAGGIRPFHGYWFAKPAFEELHTRLGERRFP